MNLGFSTGLGCCFPRVSGFGEPPPAFRLLYLNLFNITADAVRHNHPDPELATGSCYSSRRPVLTRFHHNCRIFADPNALPAGRNQPAALLQPADSPCMHPGYIKPCGPILAESSMPKSCFRFPGKGVSVYGHNLHLWSALLLPIGKRHKCRAKCSSEYPNPGT